MSDDCLVSFEGRQYSVPFRHAGRRVEIRGCAGRVQALPDGVNGATCALEQKMD